MKKIGQIFSLLLMLAISISCQKNSDSPYFNGKIETIKDKTEGVKEITLKFVPLDGANYGLISVYDSLMFFLNFKLQDRFYSVFNVDTGKERGTFLVKGGGPDEFTTLGPMIGVFMENSEQKTLLFAPNEEKMVIWNITQSLKQNKTIVDRTIPYSWVTETNGACYNPIFFQKDNRLLVNVTARLLNDGDDEEATLPVYQQRTLDTNKLLKEFSIYKKMTIKNGETSVIPEAFFNSHDAIKPDGTKIVQAMRYLPQLNIIDIETGEIVGYRMKDSPDFSVFEGIGLMKRYYVGLQADDNYIYAMYLGKEVNRAHDDSYTNIIHVFDWHGNLIQKITTGHEMGQIALDIARNRLYISTAKTDEVYYWEINGI